MTPFSEWESFYVIVGSSAGALIGLQFVVLTLTAERPRLQVAETGAAFATPTIVHFGMVLLLSAIMSAPWGGMRAVAVLWGLISLGGMAYTLVVIRRMRTQHAYRPVLEDWLAHALVPFASYGTLALCAFVASSHAHAATFAVGGVSLVLLFAGIHNAWDAASYHILFSKKKEAGESPGDRHSHRSR
jgi:hypothetical protein